MSKPRRSTLLARIVIVSTPILPGMTPAEYSTDGGHHPSFAPAGLPSVADLRSKSRRMVEVGGFKLGWGIADSLYGDWICFRTGEFSRGGFPGRGSGAGGVLLEGFLPSFLGAAFARTSAPFAAVVPGGSLLVRPLAFGDVGLVVRMDPIPLGGVKFTLAEVVAHHLRDIRADGHIVRRRPRLQLRPVLQRTSDGSRSSL